MKNLLIYIDPKRKFNAENSVYIEIQIENSLNYWKKEDIMLVTNFPYEYMGVKSLVVPDNLFCEIDYKGSKMNTIVYLLENKLLNDMTWFHDTEAWQVAPLDFRLEKDIALSDYGWSDKWNGGSTFFKPSALDIFKALRESIYNNKTDDERALVILTDYNFNNINDRIQRLNITYNVGKRRVEENIERSDKPVKVFHFHPYRENLLDKFKDLLPDNLKKLMYEKNPFNK
jgi:hypothetical protein